MPNNPTLAVASLGDPRDPRTWSGTPAHLVRELEGIGAAIEGIDVSLLSTAGKVAHFGLFQAMRLRPRNVSELLAQVRSARTAARSDFQLSRMVRNRRSRYLAQRMKKRGLLHVLHMVPYAVPVDAHQDEDIEHYLVLDFTEDLGLRHQVRTDRPPHIVCYFRGLEREAFSRVAHFFPLSQYVRENLINEYGIDAAANHDDRHGLGKRDADSRPKGLHHRAHSLFRQAAL